MWQETSGFRIPPSEAGANLDQAMSKVIASSAQNLSKVFQGLTDSKLPGTDTSSEEQFPSLLHWTSFHGLSKAALTLLSLTPKSCSLAAVKNRSGLNAADMAETRDHKDLAQTLRSKMKSEAASVGVYRHRYDYPAMAAGGGSPGCYDVPRKQEDWYVVPPPPRPVKKAAAVKKDLEDEEGSYITMQPRSNSASSRTTAYSAPSAAASGGVNDSCSSCRPRSNSDNGASSAGATRSIRTISSPDEAFRNPADSSVQRPQSREEVIRAFCDLKNREIILADDYGSGFQEGFLKDEDETTSKADTSIEDITSDLEAAAADSAAVPAASTSSWSTMLKG